MHEEYAIRLSFGQLQFIHLLHCTSCHWYTSIVEQQNSYMYVSGDSAGRCKQERIIWAQARSSPAAVHHQAMTVRSKPKRGRHARPLSQKPAAVKLRELRKNRNAQERLIEKINSQRRSAVRRARAIIENTAVSELF